jgi:Aldehyde ferredoxin oxidoreductase, N-terminal domain
MPAGGYFGRALVVDVGTGTAQTLELSEELLRAYIGGVGLGAALMHKLGPPGVDPLAPEAPLAYVFSPLVGTPLTTSAKFAVVAKSPLTGMLTDALASSHFAIAGKLTGYDAIVVTGACAAPSALLIDKDGARIQDAADLVGLTAAQAGRTLRQQLGRGWRVAAIGPAGERGVRYATISHDGRRARWPGTAAPPARSAASTSTPPRRAARPGWSTRTSSPSARCAGLSDPDATTTPPGWWRKPACSPSTASRCDPATRWSSARSAAPPCSARLAIRSRPR